MVLQTEIILLLVTQASSCYQISSGSLKKLESLGRKCAVKVTADFSGRVENLCKQQPGRGMAPAATAEAAAAKDAFPSTGWDLLCHSVRLHRGRST